MSSESSHNVQFWHCKQIDMIRATADPGGDAFSIEEAEQLRDELDNAIQQAKNNDD